jgi:hypothetical protein
MACAAAGLYFIDPATFQWAPPCPFHYATGFYCAGCGSLRGIHQLLHGNLAAALRLNPLMVVSIPFLAILLAKPAWGRRPGVAWTSLVVIVAFWILRNIPVSPFTYLAPHNC